MKRMIGGILVATALFSLAACGGNDKEAGEDFSISDRYTLDENTPAWKLDKKEETTKIKWYINVQIFFDLSSRYIFSKRQRCPI